MFERNTLFFLFIFPQRNCWTWRRKYGPRTCLIVLKEFSYLLLSILLIITKGFCIFKHRNQSICAFQPKTIPHIFCTVSLSDESHLKCHSSITFGYIKSDENTKPENIPKYITALMTSQHLWKVHIHTSQGFKDTAKISLRDYNLTEGA